MLFRTRDSGVEQLPLQHDPVTPHKRENHHAELTSLGFVDADGIGKREVVEIIYILFHVDPRKIDNHFFGFDDVRNDANIAVHHTVFRLVD